MAKARYAALLAGMTVFAIQSGAAAADANVATFVNGREVSFEEPARIENDRALVPFRGMLELLGAQVGWNAETRTVTATLGETQVKVNVNDTTAWVNGTAVQLQVPARIIGSRTFVPLRFVSESLGANVAWNDELRQVDVTTRGSVATSRSGSRTAPTPAQVMVQAALTQVGKPYSWGGATPLGYDCSGFAMAMAAKIGVSLPHSSQSQFNYGTPVTRANLQPGDLVFFTTYAAGASHVGIYIGQGQFVHSKNETTGVVVTPLDSGYWAGVYIGARRLK